MPSVVLVVNHCAIGTGVEPVLVRVPSDAVGTCANVSSAVLFMPNGSGELRNIDILPHHDVLEDRAILDDLVGNALLILQIGFAVTITEFPFCEVLWESEGHVSTLAGEHVQEQAEALRAARYVIK